MSKLADFFLVRSERLKQLREIVDSWESFKPVLGVAVRFKLVVDTNVVLGDILWLVAERRDPSAKTQLMEAIEAGTLDVYVPTKLLQEVEEKIPLIAEEKGLDEGGMHAEWLEYQKLLKVVEPDDENVESLRKGVDPDDADFVALASEVMAAGIFSKDKHIGMMGGNTISVQCVAALRDYSRATAVEMHIKVNGIALSIASVAALRGLVHGCKVLFNRVSTAPDWVKAALLIAVAYVALNPKARETVGNLLNSAFSHLSDATPHVLSFIAEASKVAGQHQDKAKLHLEMAMAELEVVAYPVD